MNSILSSLKNAFSGLTSAFTKPTLPAGSTMPVSMGGAIVPAPKPVTQSVAPMQTNLQNMSLMSAKPVVQPAPVAPKPVAAAPVIKQSAPVVPKVASTPMYSAPVPIIPQIKTTSTGSVINPSTGGVSTQPVPQVQQPAPQQPVASPYTSTPSYDSTEYQDAVKAYQDSQKLSDEEIQNAKDQQALDESLRSTFTNIEGQAIPLEFVTGQKARVQDQASNMGKTLAARAALLQAKRTASTNASKFALDEVKDKIKTYSENNKPVTLSEGQIMIDPKTGKQIASGLAKTSAKDTAQDPKRVLSVTEASTLGVPFGTTAEQAYGKGQGGVSDPNSPSAPQNILTELTNLKNHSGKNFATGVSGAFNIIPGTPAASFVDKLNSVKALLTLPNLGLLKGAMSDKDIAFIQSAGTSLATSNTEKDFNDTLDTIISKYQTAVEKQAGLQEQQTVQQMRNDGLPDNVIEQVLGKKISFNKVGNTSVSIPATSRLASVNNNPGNLRFASQPGATKGEGGFAKFETPEAGVKALENQIKLDASRGLTLSAFINKYAPPSENNTTQYISQIVAMLGVKPDTPVKDIDLASITKAIAKKESGSTIS